MPKTKKKEPEAKKKMMTELFCEVRVTFSVLVEHDPDEDIDPEQAQEFIDCMTPDDWFRFGADQPAVDVDIDECSDDLPDTPENQPDIQYVNGRFVAFE